MQTPGSRFQNIHEFFLDHLRSREPLMITVLSSIKKANYAHRNTFCNLKNLSSGMLLIKVLFYIHDECNIGFISDFKLIKQKLGLSSTPAPYRL